VVEDKTSSFILHLTDNTSQTAKKGFRILVWLKSNVISSSLISDIRKSVFINLEMLSPKFSWVLIGIYTVS
jgi:hypothetical protein